MFPKEKTKAFWGKFNSNVKQKMIGTLPELLLGFLWKHWHLLVTQNLVIFTSFEAVHSHLFATAWNLNKVSSPMEVKDDT